MSLITLDRIKNKLDEFTGPYQAAYKEGSSCTDLVWAQKMLISVVMKKEFEFSKINIDMTLALILLGDKQQYTFYKKLDAQMTI